MEKRLYNQMQCSSRMMRPISCLKNSIKFGLVREVRRSSSQFSKHGSISTEQSKLQMDYRTNKSTIELLRAIFVMQMCSVKMITNNSIKLMSFGERLLGRRLFERIMKMTFYGHFVAGEDEQSLERTYEKADNAKIKLMVFMPVEECQDFDNRLSWFESNESAAYRALQIVEKHHKRTQVPEIFQTKLTPFVDTGICKKLSAAITEHNHEDVTICLEELLNNDCANEMNTKLLKLSRHEAVELSWSLGRISSLCEYAMKNDLTIIFDAEYSWINPALSVINYVMMRKFNKESLTAMFTYQANLKTTESELFRDIENSRRLGFKYGFKLVRGAYLVSETSAAQMERRENPLWGSFEETNQNYNKLLKRLVDLNDSNLHVIVASHNMESIQLACERIKNDKSDIHLYFAQSYGMCDFIADTLARDGYTVYKNLPYGPINDVMPYLHRRLQENSLVFSGWNRERKILLGDLKRKFKF